MAMTSASLTRQLGALFEDGSLAGLSDRQLIERFLARRGDAAEAAFAALVARHGPMVLGVCRQLLGDHHLAEDAFQAAFLVLARKARSLRDPDRLGTWMYGVALRTARKARVRLARRCRHEQGDVMNPAIAPTAPPADWEVLDRDQAEALHGEIGRLPEAFRSPLVLCYFQGLTLDQAASHLGCPAGTVRSRLARAREKLRRALTRRGVVLSSTAMASALSTRSTSAAVSPQLCGLTARAAVDFVARQSVASTAAVLAREVLRAMTIHRLTAAFATVLVAAACAVGVGRAWMGSRASEGAQFQHGDPLVEPRAQAARAEPHPTGSTRPRDEPTSPAPGRMFVVGRVLDPQGRPVPNAIVNLSARRKLLFASLGSEGSFPTPVGHGASDVSGGFRLDALRTSSAHHAELVATAIAPGYGVGWADFNPDEDQPSAEIRLMPEQVIEGRLLDVHGQPVSGAVVSVSAVWRTLDPTMLGPGHIAENHLEGPFLWWGRTYDRPGWPKPVTTDADGRFELRGIGRGVQVRLGVFDPRFAPQTIEVANDAPDDATPLTWRLQPARTLTGRVAYADTGRPVSQAEVHVGGSAGEGGVREGGIRYLTAEADAEGRFRISVMPGDRINIWAAAPDGQPYLHASAQLQWPREKIERTIDLALPRGVLLRGKVTEEDTGQPVADAVVSRFGGGWALTKPDGSFAYAVEPRPGYLSVQAPGEDYQVQAISTRRFTGEHQGLNRRMHAHAFLLYDRGPGAEPPEIRIALRRGATVRFRLIGPGGQPVPDALVYSRAVLGPTTGSGRSWPPPWNEVALRGHFEIHGLDRDTEVPVHFLQPKSKLGATVRVSGQMAAQGPVTVRLEPCGQAMARLVGPDGRPVTGQTLDAIVRMVVTPAPPPSPTEAKAEVLRAEEDVLGRLDPVNHGKGLFADAQGRIVLPALIPGATYRIMARGVNREFTVGPGEAVELGDILIAGPQRKN